MAFVEALCNGSSALRNCLSRINRPIFHTQLQRRQSEYILRWWLSCWLYQRKLSLIARLIKTAIFIIFHAILPYQAEIEKDVQLQHYGLGIVIHPNVKIGHRVKIFHQVTLATETWIGSPYKIFIENDAIIGAGAKLIGRGDRNLTVGEGAIVGANAVVTCDVLPGQVVVGVPARPIKEKISS